MTDSNIKRSIENQRLYLAWSQWTTHYLFAFIFLIPLVLMMGLKIGNVLNIINVEPHSDFKYVVLISTPIAIVSYLYQRYRLRFKVVRLKNIELFKNALIVDAEERKTWRVDFQNDKALIIKTYPRIWSGSWGEQMTLLFDGDFVFINSICDPDKPSSVFSAGRNKMHVNFIVQKIKTASA